MRPRWNDGRVRDVLRPVSRRDGCGMVSSQHGFPQPPTLLRADRAPARRSPGSSATDPTGCRRRDAGFARRSLEAVLHVRKPGLHRRARDEAGWGSVRGTGADHAHGVDDPGHDWRHHAVLYFMAPQRMWASWLLVAYNGLGLGLAGLCFVAIHYTTGSTWSVAIRRVPEALAGTLPFSIALLAILFIVHPQLYGWTAESFGAGTERAMAFKRFWLSRPFFLVRAAIYSGIWILFAIAIRGRFAPAGPGRRSAVDPRELPAVSRVPRAVRHYRHFGQRGLGDVARVPLVQHDLRRVQLRGIVLQRPGRGDPACPVAGAGGAASRCVERIAPARSRKAAVRVQRVLGVHLVQPVHADLVHGHPRRNVVFRPCARRPPGSRYSSSTSSSTG